MAIVDPHIAAIEVPEQIEKGSAFSIMVLVEHHYDSFDQLRTDWCNTESMDRGYFRTVKATLGDSHAFQSECVKYADGPLFGQPGQKEFFVTLQAPETTGEHPILVELGRPDTDPDFYDAAQTTIVVSEDGGTTDPVDPSALIDVVDVDDLTVTLTAENSLPGSSPIAEYLWVTPVGSRTGETVVVEAPYPGVFTFSLIVTNEDGRVSEAFETVDLSDAGGSIDDGEFVVVDPNEPLQEGERYEQIYEITIPTWVPGADFLAHLTSEAFALNQEINNRLDPSNVIEVVDRDLTRVGDETWHYTITFDVIEVNEQAPVTEAGLQAVVLAILAVLAIAGIGFALVQTRRIVESGSGPAFGLGAGVGAAVVLGAAWLGTRRESDSDDD